MEKMKAVLYNKKGSPEKLSLYEIDKPVPDENEVLIRVHAVSLNAADYRSIGLLGATCPMKREDVMPACPDSYMDWPYTR